MYDGSLIRLRAFKNEDLDEEYAFVNDYETVRTMMSGIPFPSTLSDEQQWLSQQSSYTRGEYQFAVEDFDGNFVGRCGIIKIDWKNRVAELAIMIGSPYRHRGYGREAMQLLVDFCFREMNVHRLKVTVFAMNEPAMKTYLRCGFVQEGLLRDEVFRDGEYRDVAILGLINPKEQHA